MNVYQCLMMVATGSTGAVLAGFEKALGFQKIPLNDWPRDSTDLDRYCQTSQTAELNSVSSVWPQEDFHINQAWRETVEQVFGATVQPMQLAEINAFIEKGTRGKFKDLVSAEDLEGCVLMLITCLYFKAKWAEPFSIRATVAEERFYSFTSKPQTCSMMCKTGRMRYIEDPNMQICVLPYKAEDSNSSLPTWKAAIILPNTHGHAAIKDILSTFSKDTSSLQSVLTCTNAGLASSPKVNLRLPRFTLRVHLDLKEALGKLGLGPAFSSSRDFAPISDSGPLMISRVTHDLVIEVNEEGTEMAAVTIVGLKRFVSLGMQFVRLLSGSRPPQLAFRLLGLLAYF